ncbi:hypothetical protein EST38_g10536 [Candolleomyces aberdarensis]|uniref:AB hydrolase-1 domain-containing protein n=1 Tax=Candolleomyces aberdarensis TaxID=2316362 RepID=A0A4Q2D753_9AGAR|nr:hypothetical protein EST38_g10536 [Candolleomyces aberdarensis]
MPFVSTKTPSGPVTFHYNISTPTRTSTTHIDPSLPTILFLHPVYVSQHIFHPQFCDPKLRRFNLVGYDARIHGKTKGDVPSDFRRAEAAEDVYHFMQALSLPACHVVGLSLGGCVSLQLAVAHPDKVLSLTMVSPLPLEEPADVAEGRTEIYECWAASQQDADNPDEDALLDAVCGALQLGFNGQQTKLIQTYDPFFSNSYLTDMPAFRSMIQLTVPDALRNWTRDRLEMFYTISVKFFCDRKPHSPALLKQIECPITLIHCGADIAYPITYAQELLDRLEDAGLNARLLSVKDAPHFGTVTHSTEINKVIHDVVIGGTKHPVPPAPAEVVSPFEEDFAAMGCPAVADSDDSDDDLFVL